MAVAGERKVGEAEKAKAAEVRTQVEQQLTETLNRLQSYTQYIESQVGAPPAAAMLDYATAGYLRQTAQYEARQGQLHQAYSAIQGLEGRSVGKECVSTCSSRWSP